MSYVMPPPASTGAQTTSTSIAPDGAARVPSASYGPPAGATVGGGGGGYVSTFQSPQQLYVPQQPSQPQLSVPGVQQPVQPSGAQRPGVTQPWPGQPTWPGGQQQEEEAPQPKVAKSFWVQTRFGGRAWTDDLMYADYGVAIERAAHHAQKKPESDRDLIAVGRGDAYICRYTVGRDGNWVSDCPGASAGGEEAMGYNGFGAFSFADGCKAQTNGVLWSDASGQHCGGLSSYACGMIGGKYNSSNGDCAMAGAATSSATSSGTSTTGWWDSLTKYVSGATAGATSGQPTRTRCGQTGAAVTAWQTFLVSKGLFQPAAVDGAHGNITEKASQAYEGKPQTGCVAGATYAPPPSGGAVAPTYMPPGGGLAPKATIMGLPKTAVYVGAGSLVLLGAAIFLTRKTKPVTKVPSAPVMAKATANI